jgi:selenocysteine lyase/cysteine desulfurase
MVRVGLAHYNTAEEVDRLVAELLVLVRGQEGLPAVA